MNKNTSQLFNKEGYVLLKDYIGNITHMQKHGPWKLPLRFIDKAQLALLSFVIRFSWFANNIYIRHESWYSPAYSILINYLIKKRVLDAVLKADSYVKDFFYIYSNKSFTINNHRIKMFGQSSDKDIEIALSKSIGEILERTVSGIYDTNKMIMRVSPNDIQKKYKVVYPPKHHRFLKVQRDAYRELQHNADNPIEWVKGKNIITKESTYIPRQMTSWFGYGGSRVLKEKFVDQNSNGCAGYFTKEGATVRALLEEVSRDGFLVHWLTMIAPDVIQEDSLPKEIQETVSEFASRGITLYIVSVTSLSIPSVYVVAINHQAERPKIIVSGAADVTYYGAVHAAIKEMVMLGAMFHSQEKSVEISTPYKPFISDISKDTRLSYWQGEQRLDEFNWFISGKKVLYKDLCSYDVDGKVDSDIQKLQTCLDILQKHGEDYYPVVYYPRNTIQDSLGFYVAQVYIPKAFPFYLRECYGTFDSDRLDDFAKSKNIQDWKLNEKPHMFN